MSRKSKPILIVTSVSSNANGKYITGAHLTNGISIHHFAPQYIWGRHAYIEEMERKYKLKYKLWGSAL